MKKMMILLALLISAQAHAFSSNSESQETSQVMANEAEKKDKGLSSSSGSLYTEVECDMTDYTCYRIIMDLGKQEAMLHLVNGGNEVKSSTLAQAITAYKEQNAEASILSDEDIIFILATQ